jgi:hypothetical protein
MHIVDIREPIAYGSRQIGGGALHFPGETMESRPSAEPKPDYLGEKIGAEGVVVAAISGLAHPLGNAAVEEATRLGADTCLADVQLLGQLVERAGLTLEEERAEEAAGDAGEAVGLGGEAHALDEGVIGHGGL